MFCTLRERKSTIIALNKQWIKLTNWIRYSVLLWSALYIIYYTYNRINNVILLCVVDKIRRWTIVFKRIILPQFFVVIIAFSEYSLPTSSKPILSPDLHLREEGPRVKWRGGLTLGLLTIGLNKGWQDAGRKTQ